jgi:hypothetical protein
MEGQIISPAIPEKQKVDKLAPVKPGMEVYDRTNKKVGKVDGLYGGSSEVHPIETVVLPAPLGTTSQQTMPLMEPVIPVTNTARVPEFNSGLYPDDDFPKELRERLAHDGFVRIDAGLLHRHRYALREQIERVEGDRVVLNVAVNELIKH